MHKFFLLHPLFYLSFTLSLQKEFCIVLHIITTNKNIKQTIVPCQSKQPNNLCPSLCIFYIYMCVFLLNFIQGYKYGAPSENYIQNLFSSSFLHIAHVNVLILIKQGQKINGKVIGQSLVERVVLP